MNGKGMAAWSVMTGKELLELVRSFKLIWVPLVFILLGVMQPVTSYYMPILLEKAGNLPDGTVIEIPLPSGSQVLADTLSQYGVMGMLILVLAFMGIVSGERNSGAASILMVKPISILSYIGSKYAAMLLLAWGSLLAGYLASWYYTWLLIERVDFAPFMYSYLIYSLWLAFAMAATVWFSTLLRSAAGAAFSALGLAVLLSLLAGLMPKYFGWSPGALPGYAYQAVTGEISQASRFGWSVGVTLLLAAISLPGSAWLLRRSSSID